MAETAPPRHVAIITDGNGRWARRHGLPIGAGHRAGAENVRQRLRDAAELGIREFSVYAFSTENWARSREEVEGLIELLEEYIERVTPALRSEGVRMRFIGEREPRIPESLVQKMDWAEALTEANERIVFYVPFNYGGRAEIVHAARGFEGETEEEFRRCLYAPEMHDPELVIRTGGERRLSNYLLWQAAFSELVFSDELWPDFSRASLESALDLYRRRIDNRRH